MRKIIIAILLLLISYYTYDLFIKPNNSEVETAKNVTLEQIQNYSTSLQLTTELKAFNMQTKIMSKFLPNYPLTSNDFARTFVSLNKSRASYESKDNSIRFPLKNGSYEYYKFYLDGQCATDEKCYVLISNDKFQTKVPLKIDNGKIVTIKNYSFDEFEELLKAYKETDSPDVKSVSNLLGFHHAY